MTTDAAMPLVSVCIPTYNRAARLRRAVEKLLAGSYPNLEIIVSDNASPDATEQVCAELCRASPRVRYFRQPKNRGPTKNFEFARAQARGKYFLWHGDDDYLAADFITLCVRELERDPALVLVSGLGAYHEGDENTTRFGNVIQPGSRVPLLRLLKYVFLVDENSIFAGVYRREWVAPWPLPNMLAGDWAWLAAALLHGPAKVLPHTHVFREEGPHHLSRSLANIVKQAGLPSWHARYSWLAIPLNVANYVAFQPAAVRNASLPVRLGRWLAVFGVGFTKQVMLRAGPKIPFAGRIYRAVRGLGRCQRSGG